MRARILVIDDEELARVVAQRLLEQLNCHVDVAASGYEALEILQKQDYDIILMDLDLLDTNGLKLTKEIRKNYTNIPIVAVTIYLQTSIKRHAAALGIKDFITKPLTLEHCKYLLEKYINS